MLYKIVCFYKSNLLHKNNFNKYSVGLSGIVFNWEKFNSEVVSYSCSENT